MAANPYASAPLCVARVDPTTRRLVHAFFFLGSVPRAVMEAARRGRARDGDPCRPEWSGADAAALRGYYGPRWRELLTPVDPPETQAGDLAASLIPSFFSGPGPALAAAAWEAPGPSPSEGWEAPAPDGLGGPDSFDLQWPEAPPGVVGGASGPRLWDEEWPEDSPRGLAGQTDPRRAGAETAEPGGFGDLGFLDEPAASSPDKIGPARPEGASSEHFRAHPINWSEYPTYPEDTIHDLRLKLYLASGVPPWRQHLFYYLNEEGPVLPYRLTLDGAPLPVDWRALARDPIAHGGEASRVAGVAVDPRLEQRREGLRVEAGDTLQALGLAPGVRVTRAYFVDLEAVIPPLTAPERPNDGLAAALRDRYQFDLLYYGAVLRYWPCLSPDACHLALASPGKLRETYPGLAPDLSALRARFTEERALADLARGWRPPLEGASARPGIAVTSAQVRVTPEAALMRVAVRNVFDWIPTGPSLAAAAAHFEVDGRGLADPAAAVGPDARQGGAVLVWAEKRHLSSYGPRAAPAVDWFLARLPPRDSVAFAIARAAPDPGEGGPAPARRIPYAVLRLRGGGDYDVWADWREDDRVGFGQVAAELSALVAPTVAAVNAMGPAALPLGGRLAGLGAGRATLGGLTVSAFWPHALTSAEFRTVKDAFRRYERAGLVRIRGLQQAGAYTLSWVKGIVAWDPRLADRALEGARSAAGDEPSPSGRGARGAGARNQYAWLTDEGVGARWAALFPGRLVRVHHRATDLRVEVLAADSLAEFELVRRYLFSFLDGLLAPGAPLGRRRAAPPGREADEPPPGAGSRRLRRLQERDPALFDLKSHDAGTKVYARFCQADHQPHVFDAEEAGRLPAARRARLTPYWNFTDDAPAFYECPHPAFPWLNLRSGVHPLGYCVPCCGMTRPAPGSRAARVNAACLEKRALGRASVADIEAEAGLSRHVLSYGKAIPPGRIGETPREVGEGLFLNALPAPYGLYAVGVEQAAPAVPAAGFAYALAWAAGRGDAPPEDVLGELAAVAASAGETFYALGQGRAAAFAGPADLADAILGAFVRKDPDLSRMGPGGDAAEAWPDILAELARWAYGLEVVVLDDPEGAGTLTLEASPDAAAAITGALAAGLPGSASVRVAVLLRSPAGVYPLAALDPRLYLRVEPGERWMVARRTFGPTESDGPGGLGAEMDGPGGLGAEMDGPGGLGAELAREEKELGSPWGSRPAWPGALAGGRAPLGRLGGDARPLPEHAFRQRPRGLLGLNATVEGATLTPTRVEDRVLETVREALLSAGAARAAPQLDLPLVARYARSAGAAFHIETRLVDHHNRCYGVLLRKAPQGGLAWVPVTRSPYALDGTPTTFGTRPDTPLPVSILAEALADLNRFISEAEEPHGPVSRGPSLTQPSGLVCGFAAGGEELLSALAGAPGAAHPRPEAFGASGLLYFYHDPTGAEEADTLFRAAGIGGTTPDGHGAEGAYSILIPYDLREVDLALSEAAKGRGTAPDPAVAAAAAAALQRNRLYRLFLAEFAAVLRADRDTARREELAAAISSTRFETPASMNSLRVTLARLLRDYPGDLRRVRDLIARAYYEAPADPQRAALAALAATPFAFDRQGLARLRGLGSHSAVVAALRELLAARVTQGDAAEEAGGLPNIFAACGETSDVGRGPCRAGKLVVPAGKLSDFFDILAADVRNPGKADLLTAASAGVEDPLDFIRRPGERLTVRFEAR